MLKVTLKAINIQYDSLLYVSQPKISLRNRQPTFTWKVNTCCRYCKNIKLKMLKIDRKYTTDASHTTCNTRVTSKAVDLT